MIKLLIVDDEIDVREFTANFFRKRKLEISTAGSGEEAIEKVIQDKPNLILLDVQMEGMSGIKALEEIKKIDSTIPVIMVTGAKPEENKILKRCQELGACNYIHKPLKLEELEEVVMNTLKTYLKWQ